MILFFGINCIDGKFSGHLIVEYDREIYNIKSFDQPTPNGCSCDLWQEINDNLSGKGLIFNYDNGIQKIEL